MKVASVNIKSINESQYPSLFIRILFVVLFFLVLSTSCKTDNVKESIFTIDVSKNYPEIILDLNKIFDLKYVILDDSIDFLFKGIPQIITANNIVVQDAISNDLLFFSREGKPKSRFNRQGNGPNEYSFINSMVYDEKKDELFVFDGGKVMIYSSKGEFIRKYPLQEGVMISEAREFNNESLIIYDMAGSYGTDFSLISKENGEIIHPIELPRNPNILMYIMEMDGNNLNLTVGPTNNIVGHKSGFLLTDYSSDSVYLYTHNCNIEPFLIRLPQVSKMDPVIYLNTLVESSQYQFFQAVEVKKQNNTLPSVGLVRDKNSSKIYRQKIIWGEFRGKIIEITPDCIIRTNDPRVGFFELDIEELYAANEIGNLSGDLKMITEYAYKTNNSNNVYMFVHFKK